VDWTCLILEAALEKETISWRWASERLKSRFVTDQRRKGLSNAFIRIPEGALLSKSSRKGGGVYQQLLLPEPGRPFLGSLTHNGYSQFILNI
jgi:hypothetical protein